MDITIDFTFDTDYMTAKMSGIWSLAAVKSCIEQGKERALDADLHRILVDIRELTLPTENMLRYETGTYIAEMFRPPFRLALVGGRPDQMNHFVETVASNRGTRFRVFAETEAALDWLLSDTST